MAGDELDRFIGDMLAEKDLPGLHDDEEVFEELAKDLKQRLLDQIDRAVIDALPDERVDDLNALMDQSETTDVQIHEFIVSAGVDTKQVAIDTMLRFRDLYLTPSERRET